MFTVEQVNAAHIKVKSGADFPSYIKEISTLGVTRYDTYVTDGHINYHGGSAYGKSTAKYAPRPIPNVVHKEKFMEEFMAHQLGKINFLTFISMCAAGVRNSHVENKHAEDDLHLS